MIKLQLSRYAVLGMTSALICWGGPAIAQGTASPHNQAGTQPSSTNAAPGAAGQPAGAPKPRDNATLPSDTPRQGTVEGQGQAGRVRQGTEKIAPAAPHEKSQPNVGDGGARDAAGPGAGRSGSGGSGNAPGPGS